MELTHFFRTLPFGVYTNSSTKDRLANEGKLNAFLKVGKSLSFPLDAVGSGLKPPQRTPEALATAKASLTLPQDQLRYAQFWFLSLSALDNVACKHLEAGRTQEAIGVWSKQDNLSSLQNRLVCMLLAGNYAEAVSLAERLYPRYAEAFAKAILGYTANILGRDLGLEFLATLSEELGLAKVLPHVQNAEWRRQLSAQNTQPLIEKILQEVAEAKNAPNNPKAELEAARKLMRQTYNRLQELRQYLAADSAEYAVVADKLGLQILQCGINYYNASEDEEAAYQAMEVQSFAGKVVVGAMAKARCKENTDILQRIIDALPPREVMAEYKAVHVALKKFVGLPDKISYSKTLLKETMPHLKVIRERLGETNSVYLKLSSLVGQNALSNVVAEVNEVQSTLLVSMLNTERYSALSALKSTLEEAWEVMLLIDQLHKDSEFAKRYRENRQTLQEMRSKFSSTGTSRSTSSSSSSGDESYWGRIRGAVSGILTSIELKTGLKPGCTIAIIIYGIIIFLANVFD